MDLGTAGLNEQPFRTHGAPLSVISYASQRDALKVLEETCTAPNGLSLVQGPPLSGKSTLIQQFVDSVPQECSVAVVDGTGLTSTSLLEAVLRRFGYVLDCSSTSELLAMLRVFALQQAASHEPPILIVENAHALDPGALHTLCELAAIKMRGTAALKMILVSDRSLRSVIDAPAMECINKRLTHDFHLSPMNNVEVLDYLYSKLRAAGSRAPEIVFPRNICNEMCTASGGWPGILDRIALLALASATSLPVEAGSIEQPALPPATRDGIAQNGSAVEANIPPGPPQLLLSYNGKSLQVLDFDGPRFLIGRSEHNDIPIMSKFISRHHALLVRHGTSTFLMDLNSTNGTYVNSKRVSNHVLSHDDIVALGNHRIKFIDPNATQIDGIDGLEISDTAIMKTLDDMRELLAEENTETLPVASENLPTSGI